MDKDNNAAVGCQQREVTSTHFAAGEGCPELAICIGRSLYVDERFGRVAIEAMVTSLPKIGSYRGGILKYRMVTLEELPTSPQAMGSRKAIKRAKHFPIDKAMEAYKGALQSAAA